MSDSFRKIRTDMLLRRVALARARGNWREAQGEWEACIARARERVEVVVSRHSWGNDADLVVQLALNRGAEKLVENLDRLDENTFFAGMVRAAKFQCLDTLRAEKARRDHEGGSLDASADWKSGDHSGPGVYDKQIARDAEEDARRREEILAASALCDELIPQLRDDRAQKLLTMQRLGLKDPQIAEELGVQVGNLHQIRSRALKELRGLIER